MEKNEFEILERVCASTPDNKEHYLILQAKENETGNIVWVIGDDQVCAVASDDFIRKSEINYQDVCIQEFPYREHTPESVGKWLPLIQELVEKTLETYIEQNDSVCVYPQWLPEEVHPNMGQDVFQQLVKGTDYIILYRDHTMEMVPFVQESEY